MHLSLSFNPLFFLSVIDFILLYAWLLSKFLIVFCFAILCFEWKKGFWVFEFVICTLSSLCFFLRWIGIFLQACSFTVLVGFIFVIFLSYNSPNRWEKEKGELRGWGKKYSVVFCVTSFKICEFWLFVHYYSQLGSLRSEQFLFCEWCNTFFVLLIWWVKLPGNCFNTYLILGSRMSSVWINYYPTQYSFHKKKIILLIFKN